ncbi:MAG: alpha/beta hydrolase [Megasphaera sp.]|jgi:acetyl esterase/lipase|nr:alpha/beta hydrolase [Megasphaera sp.]MCH4187844.1 alpha/beta hydrolase [Megasphaera sp.]MCH4218085.1 alpha/beta hydrolase [Megasphaera sp.]
MYTIKPAVEQFIAENMETQFVMTPLSMREQSIRTAFDQTLPKVEMAAITDTVLQGCRVYDVPIRVYVPERGKSLPVLIYYHGGGFAIDGVMVYDPICRRIAKTTQHIVIAPEYRLAPENPYPAAEIDALETAERGCLALERMGIPYLQDITVCGDSAGGTLAAQTAQRLQGHIAVPVTHQILIYPVLDMTHSYPSIEENCNKRTGFTKEKLQWYFGQYFKHHSDRRAASPIFGALTNRMPDTLVITAQFCPFRDEGQDYVNRLQQLGVRAESYNVTNMVHSYLNYEKLCYDEVQDTYRRMNRFLTTYNKPCQQQVC